MNTSRALNSALRAMVQTLTGVVPILALVLAFATPHFANINWLPSTTIGIVLFLVYTISDARKIYKSRSDQQPVFQPNPKYGKAALIGGALLTVLWLAAKYNGVYATEWAKVLLVWLAVAIVYGFWFKK